jgi:hypothetical protein
LEANEIRKNVGLATLPDTWEAISIGKDYTVWKNPLADKLLDEDKPVFFSKSVGYDQKNNLISEEDLYYSGKRISTIDGHERESVSITYYFKPQEMAGTEVKGWYNIYTGKELKSGLNNTNESSEKSSLFPVQIDMITADSILKKWGFEPHVRE